MFMLQSAPGMFLIDTRFPSRHMLYLTCDTEHKLPGILHTFRLLIKIYLLVCFRRNIYNYPSFCCPIDFGKQGMTAWRTVNFVKIGLCQEYYDRFYIPPPLELFISERMKFLFYLYLSTLQQLNGGPTQRSENRHLEFF